MSDYSCGYCKKSFKRENSLITHVCEQKRRWASKDEKAVQLALHTYVKFYKYSHNTQKTKTFEDFVKSPYYTAFVRFGNYIVNTKCLKVERFIDWIIRSQTRLDDWAKDSTYTRFLRDFIRTEPVSDALTRAIEYSIAWANEKSMKSADILRYGNENRLCYDIVSGKISPWVLYQSDSGQKLLTKLSEDQMKIIWDIIDPEYWNKVFDEKKDDVKWSQEVLKDAGW